MLENDPLWYKDAIIYELHVRAFHDSLGDGYGDFRGLTQKLDYLQDLGITAVWLLPFYPSPLRDDGYDIADYNTVHPQYGTLRDFQEFLAAAHRRGIRVITELVINHTSDQHPWFQRARLAPPGSPERDFYVWSDTDQKYRDVRIIFKDFERSNWTWDPVARAYYWHRFYSHQPDLNYDNPAVQEAILPLVDYWFNLGVDGMRLDAVPYLFEREGTSCENLPETHAFLKKLRAHVDARFPGRMLLAEANQWPEDAVAYLGQGDECHMAFHFPVMPRLFMAVQQENAFPIIDILQQTPTIPESCQWAIFLRNHDELTLEMVTDEERDFMYRAYAEDQQARINLGIRRRLAPLLDNDRRRIELLEALLFSLPGTPVLYYGDEIGMGDNIYLGDRNGVRTPMQWSGDRNAGFSRANPQRLYLPVIIDPEYHYEAINVEAQQNNTSSLLWWTKRMIALRKAHPCLGRGSLEFIRLSNSRVLAFVRRSRDDQILVVANLSRFVQYAELDLRDYQGRVPEELLGRSVFPAVGDQLYPLSLAPHAFYWFNLTSPQRLGQPRGAGPTWPTVRVEDSWLELCAPERQDRLEALLPDFLTRVGEECTSVQLETIIPLSYGEKQVRILLAQIEGVGGLPRRELLPVTFLPDDQVGTLVRPAATVVLARVEGKQTGVLCDARADPAFCLGILRSFAEGRSSRGDLHEIVARPEPGFAEQLGDPTTTLAVTAGPANQTNFTIRFGDRFLLKVFRRLSEGVNPEVEMTRFLLRHGGSASIAPFWGTVEYRRMRTLSTLSVLQGLVANRGDAAQLMLDRLSSYFERVIALPRERLVASPGPEAQQLLGSTLELARQIGERLAEFHLALGRDAAHTDFAPEAFTRPIQRSYYQSMRNRIAEVVGRLQAALPALPPPAHTLGRQVVAGQATLLKRCARLLEHTFSGLRIRCHTDLQLDNLLSTGPDVILIDLEGDPRQSISERRVKRSPLYDLATLARSLHQATWSALHGLATPRVRSPGLIRVEDRAVLEPWAGAWYQGVFREVDSAYRSTLIPSPLLPREDAERQTLLEIYTLERALRDVVEQLAQPERVFVPLLAVAVFLDSSLVSSP
jgi:maltose alpha-D-glucosyltransferase/alpha-amylase